MQVPIYFDHAATSFPKPPTVIEAVTLALTEGWGNPGRSGHQWATRSDQLLERLRQQAARWFSSSPERVIFTLNGTDALNLAIKGTIRPGDRVISGVLEHNSVRRPLEHLARDHGIDLVWIGADSNGLYRLEELENALRTPTRLVAWTHASNVFGTIQPIAEAGRIAKHFGATFLVDAAQTAGVIPINLATQQIDLLATPGHKGLLGPMGTGLLIVGDGIEVESFREGGSGGDSRERFQPRDFPTRLEAGTPNVPGLAGLSAGFEVLQALGMENIARQERGRADRLWRIIEETDGLSPIGEATPEGRLPLVTAHSEILDCHELRTILDQSFGIATRAGLHCAPGAHEIAGTLGQGGIRFSAGLTNRDVDFIRLEEALRSLTVEWDSTG